MYFTTSDNAYPVGPRTGPWHHGWAFTVDGKRIGEIVETERGYRGTLEGPDGRQGPPVFTTPVLSFRASVIDHLTREFLVRTAKDKELTLKPRDITNVESGYPEIDGKPADQWLAEMSMD